MSELPEPRLATKLEAILYLKGQALTVAAIAEIAGCQRKDAQTALLELMDDYAYRDSALEVVETKVGYSLQLKASFSYLIHDLVPAELKLGALRTLAVIALKSPIVQTELIDLRGSTAYQHVPELVELGFIRKHRQPEGRSFLLEVTPKFHQYFEVDKLSEIMTQLKAEASASLNAATTPDEEPTAPEPSSTDN